MACRIVEVLKARVPKETSAQAAFTATGAVNDIHTSPYTKEAPLTASLSVNQKITGRDSEKDVRHIEIDLGDSGLRYQPGDALGIWYQNDPALVKELVELLWLKGDEPVTVDGKTQPLSEALQWHFELTVNTPNIVENYATLTRSESCCRWWATRRSCSITPRRRQLSIWCVSLRLSWMPMR
jgi:sulfite reductase (NADPH) flavoprotein alpha-component